MSTWPDGTRPLPLFLSRIKGASRITSWDALRISEVFDKTASPTVGAILVAVQADFERGEIPGDELPHEDVIVALAVVRGVAGVASGAVRATLAPIYRLPAPVSLDSLVDTPVELGEVPPSFNSRALGVRTATALVGHLKNLDPSVATWLAEVTSAPRRFTPGVEQARSEAKDAVQLAAQFAEMELPPDAFVSPLSATEHETLLQTLLNAGYERDLEEELLPLDLQRFDGRLIARQRAASMTVFEDRRGKEKLVVLSVNKKPLELELGVDLLYWDQVHDSFTFVQYKRLERTTAREPASGSEWAYLRRGEIERQLALMPVGQHTATTAADWRAFGTPFWFKFVRGDAGRALDGKTLKGMHVPADWLRLAISDGTLRTGPKGGFRISYANARYLGRTSFTQLISRGFVGTSSARSSTFKEVLKSDNRELIVAVRAGWQEDD